MATTLSLAEVKARLSEIVSRVSSQHERVTVTVHGKASAVLVAPEDLEALEETLEVLSDPAAMQRLAASEEDLACGRVETREELIAAVGRAGRRGGQHGGRRGA
ncbi:MAG: type II toxin-antitoxin system Phd/YefM family antitoxin [Angustibacter sp.]